MIGRTESMFDTINVHNDSHSTISPIILAFDLDKIRYKLKIGTKLHYATLDDIPKVP